MTDSDANPLDQIAAALDGMQAEINAQKVINQILIAMSHAKMPNRSKVVGEMAHQTKLAISRFSSYAGTPEQDSDMMARMQIFAHDFFDEILEAYKKMPKPTGTASVPLHNS